MRAAFVTLVLFLLLGCVETPQTNADMPVTEAVPSEVPFAPKAGKISADEFADLFAKTCMKSTPDFLGAKSLLLRRGFTIAKANASEDYPDLTSIQMKDTKREIEADFGTYGSQNPDVSGSLVTVIKSCTLYGPVEHQAAITRTYLSERLGLDFEDNNDTPPSQVGSEGSAKYNLGGKIFSVYDQNSWLVYERSNPNIEMPPECGELPVCRVWNDTQLTIQLDE